MSEESKNIEQPGIYYQRRLMEIMNAEPTDVVLCGHHYRMHWLRPYVEKCITRLMLSDVESDAYWLKKRNVRAVAYILLNDMWKIKFFHWLYWRWLFYVRQVSPVEVLGILEESKKKMTTETCMLCTTSLIGMMDTMMAMTREEARLTRAVPPTEQPSL